MKILNEKEISNIINNQNKLSAEDEFNILQSFFMKSNKCEQFNIETTLEDYLNKRRIYLSEILNMFKCKINDYFTNRFMEIIDEFYMMVKCQYCENLGSEYYSFMLKRCLDKYPSKKVVIAGIGTKNIIGDSLGPMVVSLLKLYGVKLVTFGSLNNNIHALTIDNYLKILDKIEDKVVIAIDSTITQRTKSKNHVIVRNGCIKPGSGVGKDLPPIGDISLKYKFVIPFDNLDIIISILQKADVNRMLKISMFLATVIINALNQYMLPNKEQVLKNKTELDRIICFAATAHQGQVDKAGRPYIFHLLSTAESIPGDSDEAIKCKMTCILHDIIENTDVTVDILKKLDIPDDVINAVILATKEDGYSKNQYFKRIKKFLSK